MDLMTIGAFAERTRLSSKALRLYDRLLAPMGPSQNRFSVPHGDIGPGALMAEAARLRESP